MRVGRLELTLREAKPKPSPADNETETERAGTLQRIRRLTRRRALAILVLAGLVGLPGTVAATMMGGDTELAMSEEDWGASILDPDDADFVEANWERAMDIEPIYDEGLDLEDEEMEPLTGALGANGIPEIALDAYYNAEDAVADSDPQGGAPWSLVAAIGRVESNHGRFGGAQLLEDGYGTKPIRGIPLDGRPGVALIRDTDNGSLDDDTTFDRAVGPMQFIPTSWPPVAADGNTDGMEDPDNIYDAAIGTAVYLSAVEGDLYDDENARREAVFRYNHSDEYVRTVLSLAEMYEEGDVESLAFDAAEWDDDFDGGFDDDSGVGGLGPDVPEPDPAPGTAPRPPAPRPTPRPTPTPAPAPDPADDPADDDPADDDPADDDPAGEDPAGDDPADDDPAGDDPADDDPAPAPEPDEPADVPTLPEPPDDPISVGWPQGMNELPPAELPPPPTPPTTAPAAPTDPKCPVVTPADPNAATTTSDPAAPAAPEPGCDLAEDPPATEGAGSDETDGVSADGEAADSATASPGESSAP